MVNTENVFCVYLFLKLFAYGTIFTWIYSVLLSWTVVLAEN